MKRPITDADIDRLLAAPRRGPVPELDRRWQELSAQLAQEPRRTRAWWRSRGAFAWLAGPLAVAASVALWLRVAPAPDPAAEFDLILGLDASLAPAAALLEADNRELLAAAADLPDFNDPTQP